MKCLSVLQPWASLIILGAKKIETRSWSTKYRGKLLIHASKGFPNRLRELSLTEPFRSGLGDEAICDDTDTLPTGVILGSVTLHACITVEDAIEYMNDGPREWREKEIPFGDYSPGRFAWLLTDATPLVRPVPLKGSLGIYNVPGVVIPYDCQ